MRLRSAPAIGLLLTLAIAGAARAADFDVTVRDRAGRPVKDAVVTLEVPGAGPARIEGPYEVVQQNLKFNPTVLIVPVGAEVAFPNKDVVRHHVYSFSPTKPFELKLYGREAQVRTVKFDKPGVVALGCNIHDSMVGFIKVVSTPFAGKTGPDGRVRLRGLPNAGAATLKVWQPYQKAPNNEIARPVALSAQEGATAVVVDLRTPPDRDQAY